MYSMLYQCLLEACALRRDCGATGSYGRALIDNDEASLGGVKGWQVGVAVAVTLVALLYMGRLAQQALDEAEQEEGASP